MLQINSENNLFRFGGINVMPNHMRIFLWVTLV